MFQELWNVINLFDIKKQGKFEVAKYESEYLDTDFNDIFTHEFNDNEMYTILKDGSIRKTVVYISEKPKHHLELNYLPRYHIYNCNNLKENLNNGKRYKKVTPINEKFLVLFGNQRHTTSLQICGTCYKQYINKYGKTFNLTSFLSNNRIDDFQMLSLENEFDSVPKIYAKDWKQISTQLKKLKNYSCEECGINLNNGLEQFLHTHHTDCNPRNNTVLNLKVLCIECHSKQPGHDHIKNNPSYANFINLKNDRSSL